MTHLIDGPIRLGDPLGFRQFVDEQLLLGDHFWHLDSERLTFGRLAIVYAGDLKTDEINYFLDSCRYPYMD